MSNNEVIDTTAEMLPAVLDAASLPASVSLERDPALVMSEAVKAAKVLAEVIASRKKKVTFGGEQYIDAEGWATVARFYGLTAKVEATRAVDYNGATGWEAEAVVLHVSTGQVVGRAEAMCLNDEANWKNKPQYQLRSMSQTRACAKALRSVLAWVVVLAGFSPTPAEEMEGTNLKREEHDQGQQQRHPSGRGSGAGASEARPPDEKQKVLADIRAVLDAHVPEEKRDDALWSWSHFKATDGSDKDIAVENEAALEKIGLGWLKKIRFAAQKFAQKHAAASGEADDGDDVP